MNLQKLVDSAYLAFSHFEKPEHATNYQHCEECAEYDETLSLVSQRDLSIEQIGTVCWGPVPFLTPEATAYYMPRLIELAAAGVDNKDRDPYFTQFINSVSAGPTNQQYSLFGAEQNLAVASALLFIKHRFYSSEYDHGWEDVLESSIAHWSV